MKIKIEDPFSELTDLEDVLAHLQTCTDDNCDHSSLPIFGGEEIIDTGVWSWDKTHKIEGECGDNFEIVLR